MQTTLVQERRAKLIGGLLGTRFWTLDWNLEVLEEGFERRRFASQEKVGPKS